MSPAMHTTSIALTSLLLLLLPLPSALLNTTVVLVPYPSSVTHFRKFKRTTHKSRHTHTQHPETREKLNMASEQVSRRRENTASELEIHVDTEEVPKMTIQVESPAEKERASDPAGGERDSARRDPAGGRVAGAEGRETTRQAETTTREDRKGMKEEKESSDDKQLESLAEKVKTIDVGGQRGGYEGGEREGHGTRGESLEEKVEKIEIGRAAMKGASRGEEIEKERGRGGQEGGEEMQGQQNGHEEEAQPTLEEISRLRALAQQNSMEILRAAEERYNQAKEMANQGLGTASEKAAQTKETVLHGARATTEYVAEKGATVKEKAVGKDQHGPAAAKETVLYAGKTAKDYTVPKAEQAKDYAMHNRANSSCCVLDDGQFSFTNRLED